MRSTDRPTEEAQEIPLPGLLTELLAMGPAERGRTFELRLTKWILTNAPLYTDLLREVWLWDEWPGRWGPDCGIDLVAETVSGDSWAIQCKAYTPGQTITKADVDSFLSESNRPLFQFRLLVATTNSIGKNARNALHGQEKPVGTLLLDDLLALGIQWPDNLAGLSTPATWDRYTPRPHQEEALDAVCAGFRSHDRGQLVMACGTGKTLVSLWAVERLEAQRVLVLVPSLSLLSQTLRAWTQHASRPFAFLPVCSDPTVADERDAMVGSVDELGVPATTDATTVRTFLSAAGPRVVFATYQSSQVIAEAQRADVPAFDLIVADEAHRCAGLADSAFTRVLDGTAIHGQRRLFMTATPRFFTGRVQREAAERDLEVASMDDLERFGPLFHALNFSEAIARDLLTDYEIHVIGVDDATCRQHAQRAQLVTRGGAEKIEDARTLAAQIAVAKALKTKNLRRVITFHGRVKAAKAFSHTFPSVVAWMPEGERADGVVWANYVEGTMPAAERAAFLRRFAGLRANERGLLANARCLSEGVDVPAIDGVAFIDPKGSQTDIVQAVGRAIRKAADKNARSVVLIPLFLEAPEEAEAALATSAFAPLWNVLRALRTHDDVLAEELDSIRRELGARGDSGLRQCTKIVLDIPEAVDQAFGAAFYLRLVKMTTSSWEEGFGALLSFNQREGHSFVPTDHEEGGTHLGNWTGIQRMTDKKGVLSRERKQRLDELGFVWDARDAAWEQGFAALKAFSIREGHCRVFLSHREGEYNLGDWVANQREFYRTKRLSTDRQRQLSDLGFVWDPLGASWEDNFAVLQAFQKREGHCSVAQDYRENGVRLGAWVNRQRQAQRKRTLSIEHQRRLEELAFVWHPHGDSWKRGLDALKAYGRREAHTDVPRTHREGNVALGNWVTTRRGEYGAGILSQARKSELEELGFVWDPRDAAWELGFAALRAFKQRMGHTHVSPSHFEGELYLGKWIGHQRSAKRKGALSRERQQRLEELGLVWDPFGAAWEKGFAALRDFKRQMGHTLVSQTHVEGELYLGRWISQQRNAKRKGTLSRERKQRLDELGFVWDARDAAWELGFAALKAFSIREGHCRVPFRHLEGEVALGKWVKHQRLTYRSDKLLSEQQRHLSDYRLTRLEALGFQRRAER